MILKKSENRIGISRISFIFICIVIMFSAILFQRHPEVQVQAEDAKIVYLSAEYTGTPVMVGKEIDVSKLKVSATYEDGTTNEIKDYSIISKVVAEEGSNQFMVICQGKIANFYVQGKKLKTIQAYYAGPLISVGNTIRKSDVKVNATFGDGSSEYLTDFLLQQKPIIQAGKNTMYIICEDQQKEIIVYGIEPKEITALYANYVGGDVTVGGTVNRDNLTITAAYKDGSSEIINNYILTPEVLSATGTQAMAAHYQDKSVTFTVKGIERTLTGITAKYTGGSIGIGHAVNPIDVVVTGTYNDGSTKVIQNFNLLSASITYVGYQVVTAEVDGHKAEFMVQGIKEQVTDYSNSCEFTVKSGSNTAKVAIAVPKNADKDSLSGKSINVSTVSRLLSRVTKNSTALAFDVEAKDEKIEEAFPFTMKITIPSGFNLSSTALYFTPNKKTVIAKMTIDTKEPKIIEVTIFHPGTYILTNKGTSK